MRDRAYFSARAVLRISTEAGARSGGGPSKYPVPAVPPSAPLQIDPDIHHALTMLKANSSPGRPTINFPMAGANSHDHSLWMSNLLVDLTHKGPNPTLESLPSYFSTSATNHQPAIANILLVWYIFLGGCVEEETFWAVDKSYVVVPLQFFSLSSLNTVRQRFIGGHPSYLSVQVMNAIADGSCSRHLIYLLEFLAAWEQRPKCLAPMTYQWCSAISEVAGRPGERKINHRQYLDLQQRRLRKFRQEQQQLRQPNSKFLSLIKRGFSQVEPGCDLVPMAGIPHHAREDPQYLDPDCYAELLLTILEIGFRLVAPDRHRPAFHLNHTSNHNWVFETAFSRSDDDALADAVSAWIAGGDRTRPGLCASYLAERVEGNYSFSPRLRLMCIRLIECTGPGGFGVESASEVVRLLNCLDADVDDLGDPYRWSRLLIKTVCSTTEPGGLSSHYWRLLGKLVSRHGAIFPSDDTDPVSSGAEVMKSLEEVEDWEKLEVWMVIGWLSETTESMEEIGRVTLKLLLERPSALPSFEVQCNTWLSGTSRGAELRRICNLGRTGQMSSESPPL